MRKLSVVFVALALVVGFSVTAMAAQAIPYTTTENLPVGTKTIEVYGSTRLSTYWFTRDKENVAVDGAAERGAAAGAFNHGVFPPGAPGFANQFNDSDLVWDLDTASSRFGVRFKSGKVGGNVEIRPLDASQTRHWFGTYDLGFGTFIVGQTWTPLFNPICNECLLSGGGSLDGYGDLGLTARRPGLQLHMPIKAMNGLLKIALLKADEGNAVAPVAGLGTATDVKLPMIEASLGGAFGPLAFTVRGSWTTKDYVAVVAGGENEVSVDSYAAALDLTYSMGPFYVRGSGYVGQNFERMGRNAPLGTYGFQPASFDLGASVEDVSQLGAFGVAGFKFNDMLSVEAGYGYRRSEMDHGVFKDKEHSSAVVLFVPISIEPAFVITPEIYWTDEGTITVSGVEQDRGNRLHAGIYWRIDF